MPSRREPFGIQAHPQIKQITDALLKGESARSISKWTNPHVGHSTVSRYSSDILKPTMQRAELLKSVLPPNTIKTQGVTQPGQYVGQDEDVGQLARNALVNAPILAIRENRIAAAQDRHRRLNMIVEARAADMANIPGGSSGLLARDYKGSGDNMVEVAKVDTGLLSEFREHEKQVAQELGQWQETATPQLAIQIVVPAGDKIAANVGNAGTFDAVEIGSRGR